MASMTTPTRTNSLRTPEKPAHSDRLRLRKLLQPHVFSLTIGFVAVLGETITDILDPWPIKIVIDNIVQSKKPSGWLAAFVARTFGDDKLATLDFAVAAVLAIAVVGALSSYVEKYTTTTTGQWVAHDLRRTLYTHIQRLSLAQYNSTRTADLVSRVTSDVDAIQTFVNSTLLGSIVSVLTLVGMAGVMFYINWEFTLIALSVVPVLFVTVYSLTRRIKRASREVRKTESELMTVAEEALTSARVVKAFAREDHEIRRFEAESLENVETSLKARSLKAKLSPVVEILTAIGTCLVLWYGTRLALKGTISAGVLIVFLLYLSRMYKPMRDLSKMTDSLSKATVGYERIQEIMEVPSDLRDLPQAKRAPRLKGNIEFESVDFSYDGENPVLTDISFKVEPGQVAALVGPSGTGKTTIVSLISRFYDPSSGRVKIDGQDIRRYKLKSLREQMSFVLQETLLFHTTIWENIAYGKPDAKPDQIVRAAQLANAEEFIKKLPDGYDTLVGERGMSLSGGQRQRIAIARAIIRDTPILILDEPTSGLDASSEKAVLEALKRLMKGRTCVVIAHDLESIRQSDVIFVVQDYAIIERGSHEELLALHGEYASLYNTQSSEAHETVSRR